METFRIYLSGGMSGLSWDEQTAWRKLVMKRLESFEGKYKLDIVDPTKYFNLEVKRQKTEREARNFDLYYVRRSDLIIVNFNNPFSIGTDQEITIAAEHHIPVIGLNKDHKFLHSWSVDCCERIFDDIDELIEYVKEFYLL